eukprot:1150452-Pelagomonas_calceolata.AAC.2
MPWMQIRTGVEINHWMITVKQMAMRRFMLVLQPTRLCTLQLGSGTLCMFAYTPQNTHPVFAGPQQRENECCATRLLASRTVPYTASRKPLTCTEERGSPAPTSLARRL